jgi:hypothetical protein
MTSENKMPARKGVARQETTRMSLGVRNGAAYAITACKDKGLLSIFTTVSRKCFHGGAGCGPVRGVKDREWRRPVEHKGFACKYFFPMGGCHG